MSVLYIPSFIFKNTYFYLLFLLYILIYVHLTIYLFDNGLVETYLGVQFKNNI